MFISRAFMHDPKVYENPDDFRPERFLKTNGTTDSIDVRDPFDFVFGFGRRYDKLLSPLSALLPLRDLSVLCRICPGRDFALATITIALASLLHVFNVGPPFDEQGNPILIKRGSTDGILSYVCQTVRREVYTC